MLKHILTALDLRQEAESFETIHATVESELQFKGARLLILVFAIILASVGLNINSTAVIIGAMLISPLMGPINAVGYGLATNDFQLMRTAAKNLLFAVVSSLAASTVYFAITPVSVAHSELLARTSPTIYDVLIALFGGLAGSVSLTTRLKGNVVPGVAIATALMPPLCTAGYGLGTWQPQFFFGALYLFTINAVFIALATTLSSRLRRFPMRNVVDEERRRLINRWVTVVILVTLLPSLYFGYLLVKKEQFSENSARFIRSVSIFENEYLIQHDVDPGERSITLVYAGRTPEGVSRDRLVKKAEEFGLKDAKIVLQKGLTLESPLTRQNEQYQSEIQRLSAALQSSLRTRDSLRARSMVGGQLLAEIRPLFPNVSGCSYVEANFFTATSANAPVVSPFVVLAYSGKIPPDERGKIEAWLRVRMQNPSLRVLYE